MLSIIIPHFNQYAALAVLLQDLVPQANRFGAEVIVVDNGSARLPSKEVERYPGVRLEVESQPGPGPARNLGVAVSKGDRLAFIDADCRPAPDWLSRLDLGLDRAVLLGGDVRIRAGDPQHPTLWEAYEAEFAYRMEHYIRDKGFSGTGNLAMHRNVFEAVGPFAGIDIAEDRDWGRRAVALGYQFTWYPDMRVYHPARESFADIAQKWRRMAAHDAREGKRSAVAALVHALALTASPVVHLPRVLRSSRIPGGPRGKALAWQGLWAIRLYRAWLTLRFNLTAFKGIAGQNWRATDPSDQTTL